MEQQNRIFACSLVQNTLLLSLPSLSLSITYRPFQLTDCVGPPQRWLLSAAPQQQRELLLQSHKVHRAAGEASTNPEAVSGSYISHSHELTVTEPQQWPGNPVTYLWKLITCNFYTLNSSASSPSKFRREAVMFFISMVTTSCLYSKTSLAHLLACSWADTTWHYHLHSHHQKFGCSCASASCQRWSAVLFLGRIKQVSSSDTTWMISFKSYTIQTLQKSFTQSDVADQ